MYTRSAINPFYGGRRVRRPFVAVAAITLLVSGAAIATADTGPAPMSRVWIDDPLTDSVVLAGPVAVQAHGNDASSPMVLLVDGIAVAQQDHPRSDGRLTTTTFTWPAAEGKHTLVVRSSGLNSIPNVVYVVIDNAPLSVSTPTVGGAPTSGGSPTVRAGGPSLSTGNAPASSGSAPRSSSERSGPPATSRASTPASSASGQTSSAPVPPSVSSVIIEPRVLHIAGGCRDRTTAISAAVTGASSVTVAFKPGFFLTYTQALSAVGDRWTGVVDGARLPPPDAVTQSMTFRVLIEASGPGGTTTYDAGTVWTSTQSCIH